MRLSIKLEGITEWRIFNKIEDLLKIRFLKKTEWI